MYCNDFMEINKSVLKYTKNVFEIDQELFKREENLNLFIIEKPCKC